MTIKEYCIKNNLTVESLLKLRDINTQSISEVLSLDDFLCKNYSEKVYSTFEIKIHKKSENSYIVYRKKNKKWIKWLTNEQYDPRDNSSWEMGYSSFEAAKNAAIEYKKYIDPNENITDMTLII